MENRTKFVEICVKFDRKSIKIMKILIYNNILIIALKPVTSIQNVARVPLFVYIEVSTPYFLYALPPPHPVPGIKRYWVPPQYLVWSPPVGNPVRGLLGTGGEGAVQVKIACFCFTKFRRIKFFKFLFRSLCWCCINALPTRSTVCAQN